MTNTEPISAPTSNPIDGPVAPAAEATAKPTATAAPTVQREYHHFLRANGVRWWRGVLAIVCLLVGYLALNTGFGLVAGLVDIATGTTTMAQASSGAARLTPLTLLAVNLSAAAMIPLGGLLQWAFFGLRPRWLSSVAGRFRWPLLGRAALFVVPFFVIYVGAFSLLGSPTAVRWAPSVPLLLVVLSTTWLQAAGEEYGFRGLITRSVGSWFANPRTALLVALPIANVLFMIAHFAQDPWLIAYYFVFGLAASVISWRTGGLEVGALMHATNNLLLFTFTALTSGGSITIDRSMGAGGPFMLIPMAVVAVTAAGITWWSARRNVARTGVRC